MWPVTDAFTRTVAGSHQIVVGATIGKWGEAETDLSRYLVAGTVNVDRNAAIRRTCSLTFVDPTGRLNPVDADDLLNPASANVIRLYRGVTYTTQHLAADANSTLFRSTYSAAGAARWYGAQEWASSALWAPVGRLNPKTTELAPLGCFRVVKTTMRETNVGVELQVEGSDFSWVLRKSLWVNPFAVAAGTTVTEAINIILEDRAPDYSRSIDSTDFELPTLAWGLGSESTTDPWTVVEELAADAGWEIFYDQSGIAVTEPPAKAGDEPILAYGPGDIEVVLDTARDLDGETLRNGVVVTAEGSHLPGPLRAEAWDNNLDSPTNINGPFGKLPDFYASPRILTQQQADTAAEERLKVLLGIGAVVEWSQVVNPALDVGDVIQVEREAVGVSGSYVIDSLTIPLAASDSMTATARTLVQS